MAAKRIHADMMAVIDGKENRHQVMTAEMIMRAAFSLSLAVSSLAVTETCSQVLATVSKQAREIRIAKTAMLNLSD